MALSADRKGKAVDRAPATRAGFGRALGGAAWDWSQALLAAFVAGGA